MSDDQSGPARPDARDGDRTEVLHEAPSAPPDHRPGSPTGFEPPEPEPEPEHEPQPVTWPGATTPVDAWGQPSGDPWTDVTPGGPTTQTWGPPPDGRRRRIGSAVGLFVAGAVVGALVTGGFTGWGSNGASALTSGNGQSQASGAQPGAQPPAQGQLGRQPGAGQGGQGLYGQGPAGRGDEVRLVGTLTAVSGSKVTVRSAGGSATYTISPDTRILRNGAQAQASDLHVGDVVLVHAFPSSSTDGVLELIYARGAASGSGSSADDGSTT